jgi:hypothetical protein
MWLHRFVVQLIAMSIPLYKGAIFRLSGYVGQRLKYVFSFGGEAEAADCWIHEDNPAVYKYLAVLGPDLSQSLEDSGGYLKLVPRQVQSGNLRFKCFRVDVFWTSSLLFL